MARHDFDDTWAVWSKHVLAELERHDRELSITRKRAQAAWVLSMILQAQIFLGGVVLGYLARMLLDHLVK